MTDERDSPKQWAANAHERKRLRLEREGEENERDSLNPQNPHRRGVIAFESLENECEGEKAKNAKNRDCETNRSGFHLTALMEWKIYG